MLYLERRSGQSIILNHNIYLTIVKTSLRGVTIGFHAPADVNIVRTELLGDFQLTKLLQEINAHSKT